MDMHFQFSTQPRGNTYLMYIYSTTTTTSINMSSYTTILKFNNNMNIN